MKNIFKVAGLLFVTLLVSCVSSKNQLVSSTIPEGEIHNTELEFRGYDIYESDSLIAKVTSIEWEYTVEGGAVKEISVTSLKYSTDEKLVAILRFVSTRFPNSKIEINLDGVDWKLENKDE